MSNRTGKSASPKPRSSASPAPPSAPSTSSAPSTTTAPSAATKPSKSAPPPPPKPANVFTSDGSFLDRFKVEDGDKTKADQALARKKAADERFKNRGKRPAHPPDDADAAQKKAKLVEELNPYLKEVQKASSSLELKEEGASGRTFRK